MNPARYRSFSNIFILYTRKILLLLSIALLSFLKLTGQPTWVSGTPSVISTGPTTITVNYGINIPGTVYIIVSNTNQSGSGLTPGWIKWATTIIPFNDWVTASVIPVTAGNTNTILQTTLNVIYATICMIKQLISFQSIRQ